MDEAYPAGTEVFADYSVIPPPSNPTDATDAIQAILDGDLANGIPGKSVVLPTLINPGAFYIRPHREEDLPRQLTASVGLQIPEGLGIRGQDERLLTKKGFAYDRQSVLKVMPGQLGTTILRQKNQNLPQVGAFLRNLTVHGCLDSIDLLSLTGEPPQSHHGVQFGAVENIVCEGARFTACFDDGLKFDREKLQRTIPGLSLSVSHGGRRFQVPPDTAMPPFAPPVREGTNKIQNDPNTEVRFSFTIPAGSFFGGWTDSEGKEIPLPEDLTLYAANATEPRGGLAPIGFLTQSSDPYFAGPNGVVEAPTDSAHDDWRPFSSYVDRDEDPYHAVIGWLNPLTGEGCMEPGYFLPTNVAISATVEAVDIVSNKRARVFECELDQNGRNAFTMASCEGIGANRAEMHSLTARGNGRLDAAIGLSGSFAADLQLGTTARFGLEYWQEIDAADIEISGGGSSSFKVGQEVGLRYQLGPATYDRLTIRDGAGKGIKTGGYYCGPLTFIDFRGEDCADVAMSLSHAGGTDATGLRFNNPKVPLEEGKHQPGDANFDVGASLPDLSISNDAYHPTQYYRDLLEPGEPGVRHIFRDIVGEGEHQAFVGIRAFGVEIDGASNVHFDVQPSGRAWDEAWDCKDVVSQPDPPVVLSNIDLNTCTYSPTPLPPGTVLNGVVQ